MKPRRQILQGCFLVFYMILFDHLVKMGTSASILFITSLIMGFISHLLEGFKLSDTDLQTSTIPLSRMFNTRTRVYIVVAWIGALGLEAYYMFHQTAIFMQLLGCTATTVSFKCLLTEMKNLFLPIRRRII